jgi:hypothetical protein
MLALACGGTVFATEGVSSVEGGLAVAIEQALDQSTDLDIQDKSIAVAFDELSRRTGVRIDIDASVLDRLPYGPQTALTAKFEHAPLRECLRSMLAPLGLTFAVRENAVHVLATAPLRRIVRRATWDELDTLKRLAETPWSDELWQAMEFQFDSSVPEDCEDPGKLRGRVDAAGAGSAGDVLEIATATFGCTWYPSGRKIVVLSKKRQIERQLEQRVSLRFFHAPVQDVLLDLGREAGTLMKMDPGVIALLPRAVAESFSLTIENTTIRQALEVISGTTGLRFDVDDDGIHVSANPFSPEQGAEGTTGTAAARANEVVGIVTLRNEDQTSNVSLFIREGDLPPDVNAARKKRIDQAVEAMRKMLAE